jgi:hypothetical protein
MRVESREQSSGKMIERRHCSADGDDGKLGVRVFVRVSMAMEGRGGGRGSNGGLGAPMAPHTLEFISEYKMYNATTP